MPMDKAQVMAEVKKRLPGFPDHEIEQGIMEVAKAHPEIQPEEALQALDMFIAQNGAPKPGRQNLAAYLGGGK